MPSRDSKKKRLELPQIHEDHEYHWLSNSRKFSRTQVLPLITDDLSSIPVTDNPSNAASKAVAQRNESLAKQLGLQDPNSYQAGASNEATDRLRRRSKLALGAFAAVVVIACIAGPVAHFRNQQAAAAAAVAAERSKVVLPLPPMVPLTKVFYDGFRYISNDSWTYTIGNGIDRGDAFWGFGNGELQCYTADSDNVDIISPDPATDNLRLQALYHKVPITCADRWPFNTTKTHWTSGRITSKSKHIFLPPSRSLPGATTNITGTNSCTPLFFEARMKFPSVQGSRAALLMLPEPQNQTTNSSTTELPACRWVDECGKYGRWPASGEIDIVSHSDQEPDVVHAIQVREYGQHRWRATATGLGAVTSWHTYKLEWHCEYLRWFVDGIKTFQVPRQSLHSWPFDQPFFLVIEYSIGGRLVNPQVDLVNSFMLVDYVRVWPADEQPPINDTIVMDVAESDSNMTQAASLVQPAEPVAAVHAPEAAGVANFNNSALYAAAAAAVKALAQRMASNINDTMTAQQAVVALNLSNAANSSSSSLQEPPAGTSAADSDSNNTSYDSSSSSISTSEYVDNNIFSGNMPPAETPAQHAEQAVISPATPSGSTDPSASGASSTTTGSASESSTGSSGSGSSSSSSLSPSPGDSNINSSPVSGTAP